VTGAGTGNLKKITEGQFLFHEGDNSDGIYVVKEGLIDIVKMREGTTVALATLKPGDVIGTITMFSREPRTAGARAQEAATLLHIPAEHLEKALKEEVPIWAQAVIKDTIARIKHVDEQLVKAYLKERAMAKAQLGLYQHAAQLANLLALLYRRDVVHEEGDEIFPMKGLVETAEMLFFQRAEYWEKIFDLFLKQGLVKKIDNKKYGPSLAKIKPAFLEDFSNFVVNSEKKGFSDFVPMKFHYLLNGLLRLYKNDPQRDSWQIDELAKALSKDLGRDVNGELLSHLVSYGVLRRLPGAAGVNFAPAVVHKKIVFENVCRSIKDLKATLEALPGA